MRIAFPNPRGVALLAVSPPALAAEAVRSAYPAPTSAVSSGSILQIIFSLLLVLAAVVLVAWTLKRMNVTQQGSGKLLKVIGGVAVGQRERVVVVEIDNTWLVVGVGPGQIRTLHTLPKSDQADAPTSNPQPGIPFNTWLKRIVEKRNAA